MTKKLLSFINFSVPIALSTILQFVQETPPEGGVSCIIIFLFISFKSVYKLKN